MSGDSVPISVVGPDSHWKAPEPRLLFVGDCLRTSSDTNLISSNFLSDTIESANLAVSNLEGAIASDQSIKKNGPHISVSNQFPSHLSDVGFDVACLANNHAMDYGYDGVQQIKAACEDAGLQTVGTGKGYNEAIEPIHRTIEEINITLFNVCQKEFGTATRHKPGTAWIGTPDFVRQVDKTAEEDDIVVIVAHGGCEHVPVPPLAWREQLIELVHAGADLIVGHHPHIVQGWELIDGVPVFYSLGNFVTPTKKHPGTKWGAVLSCEVTNDGVIESELLLTRNHSTHVSIIEDISQIEEHRDYIKSASKVTEQLSTEQGYWQTIASELFTNKYQPLLDRYGGGHVRTALANPSIELRQLSQGIFDPREIKHRDQLKLLNYLRAEGHRDAMETALAIKTGVTDDLRTEEHYSSIESLLDHVLARSQ